MVSGKKGSKRREALIRQMQMLAKGRVNDAVKLAYLSEERRDLIDDLDLTALTEFKRGGNGAVEMKFIDRMKAMEQLLVLSQESESERLASLLDCLGGQEGGEVL